MHCIDFDISTSDDVDMELQEGTEPSQSDHGVTVAEIFGQWRLA